MTMRPLSYQECMQCHAALTSKDRKRCVGCHSVFYDDALCQKKDWPTHKKECKERQALLLAYAQQAHPDADTMTKLLNNPAACGLIAQCYHEGLHGFEKNTGIALFWSLKSKTTATAAAAATAAATAAAAASVTQLHSAAANRETAAVERSLAASGRKAAAASRKEAAARRQEAGENRKAAEEDVRRQKEALECISYMST
eukprot:TRINITY_DN1401_c0_g1_i1.p1 TRINITY_DN1401_c0_g1~~TRINITY_DN1401_c0_g1_i1.p1  ORF type:complete len:200 (+),score=61.70 TRINITY_DN1401_c0_g1_i1:348-947(+)